MLLTKCVLCQNVSHDSLVKPSDYVTFVNDIDRFSKSGLCPFKLHIDLIGDLENVVDNLREKGAKVPVTLNGVATAFVQRSKTMSARCGIAAEYAYKYQICQL